MESVRRILGGKSFWWMVLWIATIFHLAKTKNAIPIAIQPRNPMKGSDVLLSPPAPLAHIVYCSWYRATPPSGVMMEIGTRYRFHKVGTSQGPQYTGRENIYSNCSLSIQKLRRTDSANYQLIEGAPGVVYVGNARLTVSVSTC